MLITLNGQQVDTPATGDGFIGYRWFVRVAGFNPYAQPAPVLSYTLPNGVTGTVALGEHAPLVVGAEYTVTG